MKGLAVGFLGLMFAVGAQAIAPVATYKSGLLVSADTSATSQGSCVMLTVYIDDIMYRAQQCSSFPWKAWAPHEFVENGPVEARQENDKLVLRRPNGKEFKAKIIKRVRWDAPPQPTMRRAGPVQMAF